MLPKSHWALLIMLTAVVPACWAGPAHHAEVSLPRVASAVVPLYPPLARVANVEGVVRLTAETDGHKVIGVRVLDGNKLLADAATANVKTWRFAEHAPTRLDVTSPTSLSQRRRGRAIRTTRS
jgi:outer membrane biosynthesis protein TonB